MTGPTLFILGCWAIYVLIWTGLAGWSKPSIKRASTWQWLIRPSIIVMALALQSATLRRSLGGAVTTGRTAGIAGDILCALGIGLAIWARLTLGRNWGMPMSHKQDAELVTAGPYGLMRHPIYSGILLALLGTALVGGVAWFLFFVAMAAVFVRNAWREEILMDRVFPGYGAYRQRSKMLVPWIY